MPDEITPWTVLGVDPAAATEQTLADALSQRLREPEVEFEIDRSELLHVACELARLELDLRAGRAAYSLVVAAPLQEVAPSDAVSNADPAALIRGLVGGAVTAAEDALLGWEATGRTSLLTAFQQALQRDHAAFSQPGAAVHLARLAIETGFFVPRVARRMADIAVPKLAEAVGQDLTASIERTIALGLTFQPIHPSHRRYWFDRLRRPDPNWDWSSSDAVDSREYLKQTAPPDWLGWGVIAALTPPNWLQQRKGRQLPLPKQLKERIAASTEEFWTLDDDPPAAPSAANPAPKSPATQPKTPTQTATAAEHSRPPERRAARTVVVNIPLRRERPGLFSFFGRAYRHGYLGGLILLIAIVVALATLFVWLLVSTSG